MQVLSSLKDIVGRLANMAECKVAKLAYIFFSQFVLLNSLTHFIGYIRVPHVGQGRSTSSCNQNGYRTGASFHR